MPIDAPTAGVVTKLLVEDGETVTPGTALFEMEEGEGAPAPKKEAAPAKKEEAPAAAAPVAAPIPTAAPTPTAVPTAPVSTTKTADVKPTPAAEAPASGGSRGERRVKMN